MNDRADSQFPGRGLSLDAKVFLGAVLGGLVLMSALKLVGVHQLLVTLVVAGVVVGYSVLVVRMGRLHLRLDQAGDNAYYLGLVFTLLSMGWALWEVGRRVGVPDSGTFSVAETVIGDFGLALGSTLAGIICRIVLHQMRVDPGDVEAESRIQLAQAASRMVLKLNDMSAQFGEFVLKLQHKQQDYANEMGEMHKAMRADLEQTVRLAAEESVTAMRGSAEQVTSSITAFAEAANESAKALDAAAKRLREVGPPPLRLSKGMDKLADQIGDVGGALTTSTTELAQAVSAIRQAAADIAQATSAVGEAVPRIDNAMRAQAGQFSDGLERVLVTVTGLEGTVRSLEQSAQTFETNAGRSSEAVAVAEESATEVLQRLTKVIDQVDLRPEPVRDGQG